MHVLTGSAIVSHGGVHCLIGVTGFGEPLAGIIGLAAPDLWDAGFCSGGVGQ